MIDKKISVSEKVADLKSDKAKLLYTWAIPHADDFGLLPGSARTIKAEVMPMEEITMEDIGFHLEDMVRVGLLKAVTIESKEYYYIVDFNKHQTLKKDRQPQTIVNIPLNKDPKKSWDSLETLINQSVNSKMETSISKLEDNGIQMESEVKRSEDKGSEVKLSTGIAVASPVKNKRVADIREILNKRSFETTQPSSQISTEWQDKAIRYMEALHLNLEGITRSRWFKVFKDAQSGKNAGNLEKAYSYLIDYPGNLDDEGKLNYFFHIYNHGLKSS
ncbi:MAG TPA: hypothetical protein VD999_05640 [Vitreimonas sp.]|nr:hypothetical protein [Vitreimonas sp.]